MKPNVILIVTDDQGYGDIKAHGNPWINTPTLDFLHDKGVRLESFHTDPLCAPTRAGIMSGRYSFGAGVYSTLNGRYYMKPELKTMANYFKDGGYSTGMFGKWHLGDSYPYCPEDRGFDKVMSFGGGVIGEVPDYWDNNYFDDTYREDGVLKKFDGYCTDIWFDGAVNFMDKNIEEEKPFFCFLPTNAPHGPFNVEPKYYEKYKEMGVPENRAKFFGMIENVDENVGNLIEHLKEKDALDNTVIIYFGDNGTATGCDTDGNGWVKDGYNAGMRGKKGTTYEGAHRNACFILGAEKYVGKARAVDGLTAQFDLLPTFIEMCDLPTGEGLDGISFASGLKNGDVMLNKGRSIVVHNMQRDFPQKYKDYTVLKDNMRLVRPLTLETNPMALGNFGSSKTAVPEIYDIKNDPYEEHDIYENNIMLAKEMTAIYEDWYDDRVDYAIKYSPIYISKRNEVKLTCHAWHECTKMCFSQRNIRSGVDGNGYFAVEILDDGEYEFELRRYPRETNLPLNGTCPSIEKTEKIGEVWEAGKVYTITQADIKIAGVKDSIAVDPSSDCVKFKLNLKKGESTLRTKFHLENGDSIGAYYVYIKSC
ncbi:MAG: arylsulfatase [Clostridia bacterium]